MSWLVLGNDSAVEGVKIEVSPHDPDLDAMYDAALAAGQVGVRDANGVPVDDEPDAALKAARLSARVFKRSLSGSDHTIVGDLPDDASFALSFIIGSNGVIAHHFADGTGPTWVESNSDLLAQLISQKYGCPVGRPQPVEEEDTTDAG